MSAIRAFSFLSKEIVQSRHGAHALLENTMIGAEVSRRPVLRRNRWYSKQIASYQAVALMHENARCPPYGHGRASRAAMSFIPDNRDFSARA